MSGNLYLVGFMGAGKSTVGRLLAGRTGRRYLDLDVEIERREGRSIPDIFASDGEAHFRAAETAALRAVSSSGGRVVATGGGAFQSAENRALVESSGRAIWLRCPIEVAVARCVGDPGRPLAGDPEAMRRLLEAREPGYRRASIQVDATAPAEAVCAAIVAALAASGGEPPWGS